MYNIGDVNSDGWEIAEVYLKPKYTMRKRVKIITNYMDLNCKLGYLYSYPDGPQFNRVFTEDGESYKLNPKEYEFI
jgi:hypothetical protein